MTAFTRTKLLVAVLSTLVTYGARAAPARGVTDSEIIFGMTGGFTGTSREIAQSMKTGIEVALAEANAAGGLGGKKLRLSGADHENNPAKAASLAMDLVEQKNVLLLVGNTASSSIERQLPYLVSRKVLLFGTFSGGDFLYNEPPDRYVFNFRPSYAEEVMQVLRYLVAGLRMKPSEIAFFGQDDSFGDSCWKGYSKAIRRYHGDPTKAVRAGYRLNSMDVESAVRTIRSSGKRLRAVVTCGTHKQVAAFVSKLSDLKLLYSAVSAVNASALAEDFQQLGPEIGEGLLVTQVVPMPTSSSSAVMRYREQLGKFASSARPDFVSLQSYLSTLILIEGLRRAGQNLSTEKLVDSLESIRDWDVGLGAPISFGLSQHTASRKVWGTMLTREGTFSSLDLDVE